MTSTRSSVLLVLPWSPALQGGVSGVVRQLVAALQREGGPTPLIVVNDWNQARPASDAGFTRVRLQTLVDSSWRSLMSSALRTPLTLWVTHRLLLQHRAVAVNFHYTDHAPLGVVLLKRLGLFRGRLVISFHGTDVHNNSRWLSRWLRAVCLRSADAVVACSSSLADRAAQTLDLDRSRISVIFNGVNSAVFRPGAPMTPTLAGRLPPRYLVNISSFLPKKAHSDLLSAFALLAARYPDLHLCLAGATGPTLDAVRDKAQRLGLSDRIHILVGLDSADVACLLAGAQLCVQPSLAESFPLALLEAAATGVPLAASNIAGHEELIVDQSTGALFRAGDAAHCAEVVGRTLDNMNTCKTMASGLGKRVTSDLTWEACARHYLAVYGA